MPGAVVPDPPPLAAIGCAGRLSEFAETGDGRLMIALSGISRFRLREEVAGFAPYRRAQVDWAPFSRDLGPAEDDPGLDRTVLLGLLHRFLDRRGLTAPVEEMQKAQPEQLIDAVSMLAPLSPEDKQALLEAPDLRTRRETLVALLEFDLHGQPPKETRQ